MEFLTLEQLGQRLHSSDETLRKLRAEGLPIVRVSNNRLGAIWEDVIEWLRGRKLSPSCDESGAQAQSTATAMPGALPSASAVTQRAGGYARSGSASRKRPPARSLPKSPDGSIVAFRPTKTP